MHNLRLPTKGIILVADNKRLKHWRGGMLDESAWERLDTDHLAMALQMEARMEDVFLLKCFLRKSGGWDRGHNQSFTKGNADPASASDGQKINAEFQAR